MDPNGQRFWLLAEASHWHLIGPQVEYDPACRRLRLASQRVPPSWTLSRPDALARLERVPRARDAYGTSARWNAATRRVVAGGALPGEVDVYAPPGGLSPTDLALGHDGVLYLAIGGSVTMHDRRGRRESEEVREEGFAAWRLAPDPAGGAWVLDRETRRIARLEGSLWPRRPFAPPDPELFRPVPENPDEPRLRVLDATWPAEETTAGIACSPGGRVALLTWAPDGTGLLRELRGARLSPPARLLGSRYPYSLAWVSDERVAVLLAGIDEAPAYPVRPGAAELLPVGDLYPLRGQVGDPFLHGVTLPPHFPTLTASTGLNRLSLPSYAPLGRAMNRVLLDSGSEHTVWHRLNLEAVLPPDCGIIVQLAATDRPAAPVAAGDWHEHRFGSGLPAARAPGVPHGAWDSAPSELPFHPGLLGVEPEPDRAGLFTALIQRAGRRVRALEGRYLWVGVVLVGNGLATPELAAVRAYGSRFSYRDQYLPELYRESEFPPDADRRSPASTPADFLERFLLTFESVLTPLEDRIAHAYLLTDPRTAPAESLGWLGSWLGLALDPAHPEARRRAMLGASAELARWHGTLRGLSLALDLATDGAVRGGEVVVVEDFRLRRTFATILGVELSGESDPILGGIGVSGNSYVGDTLILGEEERGEFLALFGMQAIRTEEERAAVAVLFDSLAHRVTVLVHQEVEPQDLGLIRRVVAAEAPAHVVASVVSTTSPFLVGLASLVGVDTYLARRPPPQPVRVERSRVGERDFIQAPPSLDPRLEGGQARLLEPPGAARPVARAGEDLAAELGQSFTLDASASTSAPGRSLEWYRWTRLE